MTPIEKYRADLLRDDFVHDPAQEIAVQHLQRLYQQLVEPPAEKANLLNRIFQRQCAIQPVKGLYLWGGVGRGKTYLVDMFFHSLPFEDKMRMHFHRFMRMVHDRLRRLENEVNPLCRIADNLRLKARVICFDEFHVADITDAMLLANLLSALFKRGLILVATSNEPPDDLYAGGLQRQRFLPAIELIKANSHTLNTDGGTDYRLRHLIKAEIYHCPLDGNDNAEKSLQTSFERIASEAGKLGQELEVEGRKIKTVRTAEGVVWFEFDEICSAPRAVADYIEIGRCFHTVLVANIPILTVLQDDQAKRFVHLVDEFYDRSVKLIVSAAAPPEALYTGKKLATPFKRVVSRLHEMQSKAYLAQPHLSD